MRSHHASLLLFIALALASDSNAQVSGTVVDQSTSLPVAGAKVTLQATTTTTTTAPDGTFSLPDAVGSGLMIVAAKETYFHGKAAVTSPASGVEIQIRPVPQEESTSYNFATASDCGMCHPDQQSQWNGTPMSQAGQNTWVYDIYNGTGSAGGEGGFVYTRDSTHAGSNPNSECAACHQPEPWIKDPFRALENVDSLSSNAMHGVSCDVCHKIAHVDETKLNFPGIYPGAVTFTRPSPTTGQVQYGVLADVDFAMGFYMQPSYQPQLVAEMCAACHQDKNDPDGNRDFEEANGIVSEPTYGEWKASPYSDPASPLFATCVDCHMPAYGATDACSLISPDRDPSTIRSHAIEGTSPSFLENAVTLSSDGTVVGNSLEVQVTVTNDLTGHSVPTGVTVRNMILLVDAWREEDGLPLTPTGEQIVHELGGIGDAAQGYYAGLPGKLYAKVSQNGSGVSPSFYTDAVAIVFDNRIEALASDITNYTFALPLAGGTVHVRARLIYRRAFRALVDAKSWTTDGHGNPLQDVASPHFGHLMEEDEWTIPISTAVNPLLTDGAILFQNWPNPAGDETLIRFNLSTVASVDLSVYDLRGRLVASLIHGTRTAGDHWAPWNGHDAKGRIVASGVYLYRLNVDGVEVDVRRMTWLR